MLAAIASGITPSIVAAQPRLLYPSITIYLDEEGRAVCNGSMHFPLYILAKDPMLEYHGYILLKESALGLEGYYGLAIVPVAGAKTRDYMKKLAESITNVYALSLIKRFYLPMGELSQIDIAYDGDTNTVRISSRYRIFSEELEGIKVEKLEVSYLVYTGIEFNSTLMMQFLIHLAVKEGIVREDGSEYRVNLDPLLRFLPSGGVTKLSLILPSPEYKLVDASPKPYTLRFSRVDWMYTGATVEPYEAVFKPPRRKMLSTLMVSMAVALAAVNVVLAALLHKKRRV